MVRRQMHILNLALPHPMQIFTLTMPRFCSNCPQYFELDPTARPSISRLLAAVHRGASKRRQRMPPNVSRRLLLRRTAWGDRGVGRIRCHRYESHVLLCNFFQRRHLEVGRVKREGHVCHVPRCDIVQRRHFKVGCFKRGQHGLYVFSCDIV